MHKFDENMMENEQNILETKFSWKYLQFDTISSHFAQFDYNKANTYKSRARLTDWLRMT